MENHERASVGSLLEVLELLEIKWSHSVVSDCLWPSGAYEAPLSIGFSRQEYWNGLPFLQG